LYFFVFLFFFGGGGLIQPSRLPHAEKVNDGNYRLATERDFGTRPLFCCPLNIYAGHSSKRHSIIFTRLSRDTNVNEIRPHIKHHPNSLKGKNTSFDSDQQEKKLFWHRNIGIQLTDDKKQMGAPILVTLSLSFTSTGMVIILSFSDCAPFIASS